MPANMGGPTMASKSQIGNYLLGRPDRYIRSVLGPEVSGKTWQAMIKFVNNYAPKAGYAPMPANVSAKYAATALEARFRAMASKGLGGLKVR